jgi:hypothetical protein
LTFPDTKYDPNDENGKNTAGQSSCTRLSISFKANYLSNKNIYMHNKLPNSSIGFLFVSSLSSYSCLFVSSCSGA